MNHKEYKKISYLKLIKSKMRCSAIALIMSPLMFYLPIIFFRMETLGYAGPLMQVFYKLFLQHSNMKWLLIPNYLLQAALTQTAQAVALRTVEGQNLIQQVFELPSTLLV